MIGNIVIGAAIVLCLLNIGAAPIDTPKAQQNSNLVVVILLAIGLMFKYLALN